MRWHCLHLIFIIAITSLLLSGCTAQPNSLDPYAALNKANYNFNKSLRRQFNIKNCTPAKPPSLGIIAIRNALGNIGEFSNMINDVLQLNGKAFLIHFWRLTLNTTIGLGGLFDPASDLGLANFDNDFSLTLAVYSNSIDEEYLVLPFRGPTTSRQVFAMPFNFILNPFFFIDIGSARYIRIPLKIVSREKPDYQTCPRQNDTYSGEREAYLQYRRQIVTEHLQRQ